MIEVEARGPWDVLVTKLRGFVAKRVHGPDADDVLQEIVLRVHKSVGGLDDETRFGPWVYAIARNAIPDHFRRPATTTREVLDDEATAKDDDDADAPRILVDCVAPFVAELPSPYREALTLVELEGLSQQAAADVANISLSGMKSRVQRGRRMLRESFEACCRMSFDARGRIVEAARRAPGDCGCS